MGSCCDCGRDCDRVYCVGMLVRGMEHRPYYTGIWLCCGTGTTFNCVEMYTQTMVRSEFT